MEELVALKTGERSHRAHREMMRAGDDALERLLVSAARAPGTKGP